MDINQTPKTKGFGTTFEPLGGNFENKICHKNLCLTSCLSSLKDEFKTTLYIMGTVYIPTVQTGLLWGIIPISLGKIPLPKNNGGANDKIFINLC